jgi:hypothetical protein
MRGEIIDFARLQARDRVAQTLSVVQRYAGLDRAVGLLESLAPQPIDGVPIAQQLLAQNAAVLPLVPDNQNHGCDGSDLNNGRLRVIDVNAELLIARFAEQLA